MPDADIFWIKQSMYFVIDIVVGRWPMALQELDYTVGYIPGKQNDIADAMSRLCKNYTPLTLHGTVASLHAIKPISTDLDIKVS